MLNNPQLKKQAQVRETILAVFVMLALCYLAYANFYSPKKTAVNKFKGEIEEVVKKKTGIEKLNTALQKKYEQQKKEMTKQAAMTESLDPKVQMIKNYENSIFKNVSELLNYATSPDFRGNLQINSMNYDLSTKHSGYKSTKFFMTCSGRFGNLIDFIDRLEEVPALVSIDRIGLKVNVTDSSMVSLDLEGTFFALGKDNV